MYSDATYIKSVRWPMVGAALFASNISTLPEYLEIFLVSFFTIGKIESRKDPRVFAGFLLIVMIVLYIIFR